MFKWLYISVRDAPPDVQTAVSQLTDKEMEDAKKCAEEHKKEVDEIMKHHGSDIKAVLKGEKGPGKCKIQGESRKS